MCRNHSHLKARRLALTELSMGTNLRIEMDQELTVEIEGYGKLTLKPPITLYAPSWTLGDLSASPPPQTGGPSASTLRLALSTAYGTGAEPPSLTMPSLPPATGSDT